MSKGTILWAVPVASMCVLFALSLFRLFREGLQASGGEVIALTIVSGFGALCGVVLLALMKKGRF